MFGTEYHTQVAKLLLYICDCFNGNVLLVFIKLTNNWSFNYTGQIPAYIVYDNGCNFSAFCKNKKNRKHSAPNDKDNNRTAILDDFLYVVDRLHKQGHVDPVCLATCQPDNFPELSGKNTQVCEQTNSWAVKFKFAIRYMNWTRYNFFYYTVYDQYNIFKMHRNNEFCKYFKLYSTKRRNNTMAFEILKNILLEKMVK